jgi:hypothetical protein
MAHTAQEDSAGIPDREIAPMAFLSFGYMAFGLQKELFQAYQRLSRIWLERLQVEVALWTRFASDLSSGKSDADVLKAWSDHMTRTFRMTAEDGRQVFSDYQEMARKIASEDAQSVEISEPEAELDFGLEHRVTH